MSSRSVKMAASVRHRASHKENRLRSRIKEEKPDPEDPYEYQVWAPSGYTAFKALLSARLCAGIWSNITDCDETFNYWEPMHYLMHGTGFQTWEYSPTYAIRSYAYIWLHILPLRLYTAILQANKILQFYFLRCVLCFVCALCEIYFYRAVCKQFGPNTGRLTLCFLLFSSGMFISCAAFLPSSFAMYLTMTAMAGWWLNQVPVAIFSVALSALLGWPFAGALGIPIAWDLVIRRKQIWQFIKWALISLIVIAVPMVQVDSYYYGGTVVAPLNIVLYNVFSDHGANLYGVEPWTFYFLNGFLNFNVVFIMALGSYPVAMFIRQYVGQRSKGLPLWLSLGAMYIWVLIFFPMAHKEERFLFPIYPFIALAGSVALDHIQRMWSYILRGNWPTSHYTEKSNWIAASTIIVFAALSISRSFALFYGYHAPLDIYGKLTEISQNPKIHLLSQDKDVSVCVGKEWYRFPNSFFLPPNWHLQFIKSEFRGQLPKQFAQGTHATRKIPTHMNDLNIEEPSRYINITRCHYLIDTDVSSETKREPRYSTMTSDWKIVESLPFLDNHRSHKLLRSFYIPFLSEKYCTYINYNILKTTRTKKTNRGL